MCFSGVHCQKSESYNFQERQKKSFEITLKAPMRMAGLEPAPSKPGHEPESCAYANSATSAYFLLCSLSTFASIAKRYGNVKNFFNFFSKAFYTGSSSTISPAFPWHFTIPVKSAIIAFMIPDQPFFKIFLMRICNESWQTRNT